MPVPDSSSYSRRYGREDSYSSYNRSTSTSGLGRSSYLSTYGTKSSSSLPPRPPAYDIRKYTDSAVLSGSRFLSSSSASRASVSRDYGSSYRSSVSPVRGSASSIRRQLEASAPSIAERIKAIEVGENDEAGAMNASSSSTGISRVSRYSTLRAQRENPSSSSVAGNKYATYSSGYVPRDRSGSKEYGTSPLSISGSSYLNRSNDSAKSSTENLRNRSSPAPLSRSGSGGSGTGSTTGLRNGTTTRNTILEVNNQTTESSATTLISASNIKSVLATTTNTTNKPLLDASVVTTTPDNFDHKDKNDDDDDKDVENNSSDGGVSGVSSYNRMNGNDEKRRESSSVSNNVKPVPVIFNNDKDINKIVDSTGGTAGGRMINSKMVSKSAIASFTVPLVGDDKDSNGNPIVSMDVVLQSPKKVIAVDTCSISKFSENGPHGFTSSVSPSGTSKSLISSTNRFRKCEPDSNANNILLQDKDNTPTIKPIITCNGDVNLKERSPCEAVLNFKPKSSSITSSAATLASKSFVSSKSISPSGSLTKISTAGKGSSVSTGKPKVLYHTIQVEESKSKEVSPEPISYTVRSRPSLDGTAPKIEIQNTSAYSNSSSNKEREEDVSADFKITLPKLKPSTGNSSSSEESVHNNKSGTSSSEDDEINNKTFEEATPTEFIMSKKVKEASPSSNSSNVKKIIVKKEGTPPPAPPTKTKRETSSSREGTPTLRATSLSRKSPSPSPVSKSNRASPVKLTNGFRSEGTAVDNINTTDSMGPHSSKYSGVGSYGGTTNGTVGSSSSPQTTNRNERTRNPHLTSDSSDNDSDGYSTSPQLGGRFRSKDTGGGGGGYEKAGLTGLRNIGNTCFMNTVLQCLSNTKPLLEYIMKENYDSHVNKVTSGMKGALMQAFGELIQELWRDQRVVDTSAFKDQIQRFAPRFMGYSQQDAQEFLRYLLEGLHEDVNRITSKPTPILTDIEDSLSDSEKANEAWRRYMRYENSKILDMFVGQLKSTLKCTVCGHCSVTFDPFWDLSLPIPSRSSNTKLSQCFEHFTKEEVLDGDEKPTCAKCQCRRKCTKSFSIQKFPRILVVHLKRFSLAERYRGKLSTLVDYPLTGLDLSLLAATKTQGALYNLYGVANHSGSTYSGHYIAYCKHPYTGEWHCYNDSRVSPISPHSVVSSEGYVLFYEQASQSSLL